MVRSKYKRTTSYARSIPGLSVKAEKQREKLEGALILHYRTLLSLVPNLKDLPDDINLAPVAPHLDPVLLPSTLTRAQRTQCHMEDMARAEVTLRVAFAFDLIARLQKALGMRSCLTREATTEALNSTRAQTTYRTAEMNVQTLAAAYRRNWGAMDDLGVSMAERKGMRVLEASDLVNLSTWLNNKGYHHTKGTREQRERELPWLWKLNSIEGFDATEEDHSVADYVDRWNLEGEYHAFPSP